jgi:hypothetical protein
MLNLFANFIESEAGMLERADARLWFAMMSTACAVPAVVLVISAAWFMYFDFAPPIILGVPPLGPSMLAKVEAAAPPPHAAEPVAAPLTAQIQEALSTIPMLDDAHPASSDPAQDSSTVESSVMPAKPAALEPSEPITGAVPPVLTQVEATASQPKLQPTEMPEVVVAPPDAKASELVSAPPAQTPEVMPAKPAALEPSEPIAVPIPLPRPKPRLAHVSRAVSLARSPPVASSPRPPSRY